MVYVEKEIPGFLSVKRNYDSTQELYVGYHLVIFSCLSCGEEKVGIFSQLRSLIQCLTCNHSYHLNDVNYYF